jgi:hypothetical protein
MLLRTVLLLALVAQGCAYPSTIVVEDPTDSGVESDVPAMDAGSDTASPVDVRLTDQSTTMTCPPGLADCDGNAMNGCEAVLSTDVNNCGACRNVCVERPNGTPICASSVCETRCTPGFENCDGNVMNGCEVNTTINPASCGSCGRPCPMGQQCTDGTCGCPVGTTHCATAGVCADFATDNRHCGRCDFACPAGQFCSAGMCMAMCGAGTTRCGALCVNLQTDRSNCGSCGTTCPTNNTCSAGTCRCAAPYTVCSGACVLLSSTNSHCGACGTACPRNATCSSSICRCPTGLTLCSNRGVLTCVDLATDEANCGTCGTVCPLTTFCSSRVCRPFVIVTG